MSQVRYNSNCEPLSVFKPTIDRILASGHKRRSEALALYMFYYHTAKWQGTRTAKCTMSYASNGLGITLQRAREAKALLVELGLVEEIKRVDAGNKVTGWFIQVNFIIIHPMENPPGGNIHRVEKPEGNTMCTNSINASETNKEMLNTPPTPPMGGASAPEGEPSKASPPTAKAVGASKEAFDEFWAAYPKKKSKGQAERSFKKVRVPGSVLLSAIEAQKKGADWLKEGGRFIPHPSTWLNAKGWEDEIEPPPPSGPCTPDSVLNGYGDLL